MSTPNQPSVWPTEESAPAQPAPPTSSPVTTSPSSPLATTNPPAAPRSAGVSKTVAALVAVIGLLVGFGVGYLVGQSTGAADRSGVATEMDTSTGAGATTSPAGTAGGAAAPGAEATASPAPELTEEDWEAIWAARRAVPTRDPEDTQAMGEVDAPVVMVEFADFRCSYCGTFALETKPELMSLVEDGTLRIEFRDFPIFQEESIDAAVAARAAGQQQMFFEFHDALFAYQFQEGGSTLDDATFVQLAERVGVPDIARFTADLGSAELLAEVNRTYEESMQILGRPSTPQFVINDEFIGGAPPAATFLAAIEQELAKVQAAPSN